MTHLEKAEELLQQQYHCSQALFGAFAGDFGLDLKTAFKVSTCFGGGMRQGGTCGCITAALMVLGMGLGFYDSQDRELEMYGNKKTDEFIQRFREKMDGKVNCREILGKDISVPIEMAEIRKQGLILKTCPSAMSVSIHLLEEMLDEYLKEVAESSIALEDIPENEDMQSMLKRVSKRNRFNRNVNNLLFASKKDIGFIQFDIRKFKIVNDLYGDAQELVEFIQELDERISYYKNVRLQLSYGIYTVEDRNMELRQMEDRAAMARKRAKNNVLTNILF